MRLGKYWRRKVDLKKILLSSIIVVALIFTMIPSQHGEAATSLDEINKRLDLLKREQQKSDDKLRDAKKQINSIANQEKQAKKDINYLNSEIDKTIKNIRAKETEITETSTVLQQTADELDSATKRVEDRDSLLRSRVRLMYTNGAVTYLDVLFSATSFSDFLDRYRNLTMIVDQDRNILEANIKDKNLIAEAKVQIEEDLHNLELAYAALEAEKQALQKKEKDKEVLIAQLNVRKEALEDVTEEQEKALRDFATEQSKLLKEKNKIMSQFSGKFAWPLPKDFPITSPFGNRIHPIYKKARMHTGTDIGAPKGTDILASSSGIVLTAKYWGGYGNAVMVDHGSGYWTLYAHMSKISVKEEQQVKLGDKLGEVGSTGDSTGPHLHFEVRKDGEPVDAMKYTIR